MDTITIRREVITPDVRKRILKRDKYTCRYCGSKREPFHMDHVYPVIKGGETSEDNLVTACQRCNSRKHASIGMWPKPIGYFEEKQETPFKHIVVLLAGTAFTANGFALLVMNENPTLVGLSILFGLICFHYLISLVMDR